jgi:hypothetical protein
MKFLVKSLAEQNQPVPPKVNISPGTKNPGLFDLEPYEAYHIDDNRELEACSRNTMTFHSVIYRSGTC